MPKGIAICAAVEGVVDQAVVRTMILFAGASLGPVYGKQGKAFLHQRIRGYNAAAKHAPWIVLVDLDRDFIVRRRSALPGCCTEHQICAFASRCARLKRGFFPTASGSRISWVSRAAECRPIQKR